MKKIVIFILSFIIFESELPIKSFADLDPNSISASSAVVICADNGKVLYEKNAYEKRSMASTTKIMTALLALEAAEAEDRDIVITNEMVLVEGSSMGLQVGNILPISSLAEGMLTVSGNDAANAVAFSLGGSLELFSDMMNEKAKQIGMKDTHFVTPSGLDDKDHYSTAYDMALLGAYAIDNNSFLDICSSKKVDVLFKEPYQTRVFYNENRMLKRYEGCIGIKTGFTKTSGRCLVSAAKRNDLRLVAVTLNAPDDWNDHEKLLDYGFSSVESLIFNDEKDTLKIPLVGSNLENIEVSTKSPTKVIINSGCKDKLERKIYVPKFIYAPVLKDQVIGKIEYSLNGKIVAKNDLFIKSNAIYETKKNKGLFKYKNYFKKWFCVFK